MNPSSKLARITGALYLSLAFLGPFGMLYVPQTLIIPGDAAATAVNITASNGLFRAGMTSDALVFLIEIVLTVLLYVLLKPVNKTLSLVAAFSRLSMTIIQGINLLNYFFVLLLLSGAAYLSAFTAPQLQSLVLLFLSAHEMVAFIWGLFFGLHLLALGYLVIKSGYISAIPGFLLIIAALCYLSQSFGNILLPQYKELFSSIAMLSMVEIVFPLWILIKGIDTRKIENLAANK